MEMRLLQLKEENAHLRQENHEWRHRYDHLEKCLEDIRSELSSLSPSSSSGLVAPPVTSIPTSSSSFPSCSSSSSSPRNSCTSPSSPGAPVPLDTLPPTSLAVNTPRLAMLPTILPKNETRPPPSGTATTSVADSAAPLSRNIRKSKLQPLNHLECFSLQSPI
ncbi:unnamed protein product [Dibothriocephalus latus]|uniref:Uncharacterized protein n=1 Tax=Dibothriocephalus latus TaxID=60516 RepID=A0A3P7NVG6_DIBLA|nr:unnamed protein product [Dibothriocephalus latus]